MKKLHAVCAILATIGLLQGCVAAAVGGAAAGGYYVGKDERTVGEITDDATITTKVKSLLIAEKNIKSLDINVDTHLRVVTLHGQVRSGSEERRAIEIATDVKGVTRVISNLRVVPVTVDDRS